MSKRNLGKKQISGRKKLIKYLNEHSLEKVTQPFGRTKISIGSYAPKTKDYESKFDKAINTISTKNKAFRKEYERMRDYRYKIDTRARKIYEEELGYKFKGTTARAKNYEARELLKSGKFTDRSDLGELKKLREASYAKNVMVDGQLVKMYPTTAQQLSSSIDAYTINKYGSTRLNVDKQSRLNAMFQHRINMSTSKMAAEGAKLSGLGKLKYGMSKAFYAVTMDLWQGVSTQGNRNAAIMENFGVTDLESVYKLVTEKELNYEEFGFKDEDTFNEWLKDLNERVNLDVRRDAVQRYYDSLESLGEIGNTNATQYNGDDENERTGSPEVIMNIVNYVATALNNV